MKIQIKSYIVYCKDFAIYNYSCGAVFRLPSPRTARPAAGFLTMTYKKTPKSTAQFSSIILHYILMNLYYNTLINYNLNPQCIIEYKTLQLTYIENRTCDVHMKRKFPILSAKLWKYTVGTQRPGLINFYT